MSGIFTKENMARLKPNERRELMQLQMSSPYGSRSAYLPDDCGECGACGDTCLGSGWCQSCYKRYEHLMDKLLDEVHPVEEIFQDLEMELAAQSHIENAL
ncbi:hypothetical protein LCGC14_3041670 [marine sediment metagenome]|uniref:Uncharacterized protein n=1 Tax=marine sediment metagenome TaxID=412755 RepID=A0A0F8ZFB4_9ZZZZ